MRLRNGRDARCSIAYSSVLARLAYGDHRHEPKHGERDTLQFPDRSFLKQLDHSMAQNKEQPQKSNGGNGQPWSCRYNERLKTIKKFCHIVIK